MEIKYNIYYPSGNTTALVIGSDYLQFRKRINESIMKMHNNIEQVGFVFVENDVYKLEMAGGEFCGNATRSAAYYFLNGKDGKVKKGFIQGKQEVIDEKLTIRI